MMKDRWLSIVTVSSIAVIVASAILFYTLNLDRDSADIAVGIDIQENSENSQLTYIPGQNLDPELIGSRDLKFLFFGDLMLDRHVGEKLEGKHVGFLLDTLAGENKQFFSGFDIVGANLEGAVTDEGAHYAPSNAYDFAFSPARISELKEYGFNYFTLANNHFSDQGSKGVEETRKNLQALDFFYSGSTDAQADEYSSQVVELSGQPISLVGLSMVYANFDLDKAKEIVASAASTTDLVIINIHWGTEYEHQFNRYQKSIGHALIDSGADLIIGHHPHVVQGMEIYQGKPIFYSLGNFIFDQYFSSDTQEGLALGIEVNSVTTTISFWPLRSERSIPRLMDEAEQELFFKNFLAWSDLAEHEERSVSKGRLELAR